ncbi:MAG TPA: hypothetical protein VKB00_01910 [Candidatus Limnocylindrales bacterium]|nr:hypothetical protein [Candidatus Limnocylindrales bacterium]
MPLNFLRRKKRSLDGKPADVTTGERPAAKVRSGVAFDGLTEEWRLVGRMQVEGRLSDALNKREAIEISDVQWAPIDGSGEFSPAPGLRSVDPYDLIIVLAGEGSMPELTETERAAHKVHKVTFDVALEAPPFRVLGTVYLHPGMEPDRLLDRATEMFVPVVDAQALLGETPVGDLDVDTILVNRFYLRGVQQIDKRTGIKAQKLPGAPLGGITWQDRS